MTLPAAGAAAVGLGAVALAALKGAEAKTPELEAPSIDLPSVQGAEISAPEQADILQDPTLKDGMWGAYDISRISGETGWKPRPMREAMHAYMDWIVAERRATR